MSADGEHVYGMVWADRARLVELDAETGMLERTWLFPDKIGFDLSDAEVYVQGDLLVWLGEIPVGTYAVVAVLSNSNVFQFTSPPARLVVTEPKSVHLGMALPSAVAAIPSG